MGKNNKPKRDDSSVQFEDILSYEEKTLTASPSQLKDQIQPSQLGASLPIGEKFGPYHIIKFLGKGGMGEVYEAEHEEDNRRVALKILTKSLDSEEDRKRFLREGRLAAQISHPNSVYIYGTEEINGIPVISMEFVSGGTLKDRVKKQGPMPVSEAVDAILQIIEGLEAAETKGVLHRDIKPSNCFIDKEGVVKIGDFGLSISTLAKSETQLTTDGTFMGTPSFASPEQLQGKELDIRSDIYAVGATLYYLLTGKAPFEGSNLMQVLTAIAKDNPASLQSMRNDIPNRLNKAILRCLEKRPRTRFNNYFELKKALIPFCSKAKRPASLGLRYIAGTIDVGVMLLLFRFLNRNFYKLFRTKSEIDGFNVTLYSPKSIGYIFDVNIADTVPVAFVALILLYFTLTEGIWGVSLGKKICGLRVIGPSKTSPAISRAFLRALIFAVICTVSWGFLYFIAETFSTGIISRYYFALILLSLVPAILFLSAGRKNKLYGIHDLLSKTYVVYKENLSKWTIEQDDSALSDQFKEEAIGPYSIIENKKEKFSDELILGFDPKLRRKVWIQLHPPKSSPLGIKRRDLNRPGRLRLLNSKRTDEDSWDAYEAPEGMPFLSSIKEKQSWSKVRHWLFDIAQELTYSIKDETFPSELGLDRVWITPEGRAKILDFKTPYFNKEELRISLKSVKRKDEGVIQNFINIIALSALEGHPIDERTGDDLPAIPLPTTVRKFLKDLNTENYFKGDDLIARLKDLSETNLKLGRLKRIILIVACFLWIPIYFSLNAFVYSQLQENWRIMLLKSYLERLDTLKSSRLEIYISISFRDTIMNLNFWSSKKIRRRISEEHRRRAGQIVTMHPNPSFKKQIEAINAYKSHSESFMANKSKIFSPYLNAIVFVVFITVFTGFLFKGGPTARLLGIDIIKMNGKYPSRLRCFIRTFVVWIPGLFLLFACDRELNLAQSLRYFGAIKGPNFYSSFFYIGVMLLVIGIIWNLINPERGLQDRIAGTCLILR